ncbi:lytic transglycosylase domain-containing protein [Micromonospora sp. NPDC050397]|uniref:aggregation-promoting factor C-terminal-like domain-containing protein n=1 Tax=Micromonospora sp. NPDC050397 TaxID=3364279 RepID=UPI00384C23EA
MSRLWSRYGIRALAVSLLLVGVAGGYFLGEDRETQQSGIDAQLVADAERAEFQLLRERNAAHKQAMAAQLAAEREAARKATETAKAAAERAKKADAAADRKKRAQKAANAPAKPYDGPIPSSCNEYSGNRAIGCALMLEAGFPIAEMPCLEKLWTKESGWNHKASNPSGAYGIPQALPGSKMSSAGSDWQNSPATQIEWGLGYIKGRYDTPCGAWTYFQNNGHY